MNKTELIDELAKGLDSKIQATAALESILSSITDTLRAGDSVTLTGFGTFKVTERKARTMKNIQTGEELKVKAKKAPKFVPGKLLKGAIN